MTDHISTPDEYWKKSSIGHSATWCVYKVNTGLARPAGAARKSGEASNPPGSEAGKPTER